MASASNHNDTYRALSVFLILTVIFLGGVVVVLYLMFNYFGKAF